MKKIIVCCALALSSIILTVSCQKTKMNPENTSGNSISYDFRKDNSFIETFGSDKSQSVNNTNQRLTISELMEIAKIEDEEVRRTTYSLLNLQERLDYWNFVISNNIEKGSFTDSQKQLLQDLQVAVIKPNVFADNNLQQILGANFLPIIANQLKTAGITETDMYIVFSSGTIVNIVAPGGQMEDCNCNAGSHFSCSSCRRTDNCYESMDCGFGWLFACNGLCGRIYYS
ncbi:MAG: bacteriocin fulvocin C-related protein [Bacteroidota bacterium]